MLRSTSTHNQAHPEGWPCPDRAHPADMEGSQHGDVLGGNAHLGARPKEGRHQGSGQPQHGDENSYKEEDCGLELPRQGAFSSCSPEDWLGEDIVEYRLLLEVQNLAIEPRSPH